MMDIQNLYFFSDFILLCIIYVNKDNGVKNDLICQSLILTTEKPVSKLFENQSCSSGGCVSGGFSCTVTTYDYVIWFCFELMVESGSRFELM
jgi:hypothetical protein